MPSSHSLDPTSDPYGGEFTFGGAVTSPIDGVESPCDTYPSANASEAPKGAERLAFEKLPQSELNYVIDVGTDPGYGGREGLCREWGEVLKAILNRRAQGQVNEGVEGKC